MLPTAALASFLPMLLLLLAQVVPGTGGGSPDIDFGPFIDQALKFLATNPEGALTAFLTAALPVVGGLLKRPELGQLLKRIPANRRWIVMAGVATGFSCLVAAQAGLPIKAMLWKALGILTSGVGIYKIIIEDWLKRETGEPAKKVLEQPAEPPAPPIAPA